MLIISKADYYNNVVKCDLSLLKINNVPIVRIFRKVLTNLNHIFNIENIIDNMGFDKLFSPIYDKITNSIMSLGAFIEVMFTILNIEKFEFNGNCEEDMLCIDIFFKKDIFTVNLI